MVAIRPVTASPRGRGGVVCPNLLQRPRSSRSAERESLIFRAFVRGRSRPGAPLQQIRTGTRFGPDSTPSHTARALHQSQVPPLAEPPEIEHGVLGGSFRRAPDCGAVRTAQSCGSQWAHPGRGSERSSQDVRIGPGPWASLALRAVRSAPLVGAVRPRSPVGPVSPAVRSVPLASGAGQTCQRRRPRQLAQVAGAALGAVGAAR